MHVLGFITIGIFLIWIGHPAGARRIKRGTEVHEPIESVKVNSSSLTVSNISLANKGEETLSPVTNIAASTMSTITDSSLRSIATPMVPTNSVPINTPNIGITPPTPPMGAIANGMIITVDSPVASQETNPFRYPLTKAADLLAEGCSRIRHISEPLLRRKHSKFFEEHQNVRRSIGDMEQRKYKRRSSCHKPSNLELSKEEEVLVLPFAEFEAWGRDIPDRRHRSEIVEHNYDDTPASFEDSMLGESSMPEPSPLMSLAHLLFGKQHPHQRESHYKPPPNYDNDDLALVVDKTGSKLANFIHNMRTAGLIDSRSNQLEMPASNVDDEELEIRCPIHHGSGGNIFGVCTCNIVKNKHESDR